MITLSYTSMNALINCPHTWINKQMGLKTFQSQAMEDGKAAHRIIQDHVSGVKDHPALKNLPKFPLVETKDFDENMRIRIFKNGKYEIMGFVDGLNPETGEILEIKTGKSWSATDFAKLVQWKIYAAALPDFHKVWLVTAPKDPELWMDQTIKLFNVDITNEDVQEAHEFIDQAIYTLEHIKDFELHVDKRSPFCYYIDCPFGCGGVN